MDETSPKTSLMRVRNQATPRGSAKKKTTNFAGIINQMKKHEKLSKDNRSTPNTPTASTPNTPAT